MYISECLWGFPGSSVVKNSPANAGDAGLIPGSGRPPGGRNGNPLQYSCLENPMDRGAWRATVQGVAKSQTRLKLLSTHAQECSEYKLPPLFFAHVLYFIHDSEVFTIKIPSTHLTGLRSNGTERFCVLTRCTAPRSLPS